MDKLIVIDEQGDVTALHADDLPSLGAKRIARASEVEPDEAGNWTVKLTDHPLNGPLAGRVIGQGFATRGEALQCEVEFIQREILEKGGGRG